MGKGLPISLVSRGDVVVVVCVMVMVSMVGVVLVDVVMVKMVNLGCVLAISLGTAVC